MNSSARPQLLLQVLQQVDDLRLDRDVERGDRLVADDEVGLGGQRAGDADALALAAARTRAASGSTASRGRRTLSIRSATRALEVGGGLGEAEIADRLGQDVAHPHARVEAGERVLEHHLHAAAHGPQRAGGEVVDALAVEHHLAGGDVEQAQDAPADGGLAAAGSRRPAPASRPSRC